MGAMSHLTPLGKPTTRDDVARLAGVSPAVVSYVVNGGPRAVSSTTEAKVRQAIRALGYRPNAAARALALGSNEMIGMIVSDATNPFFAQLARAVENAAAERGYSLLLADSQTSIRSERRLITSFAARRVDGLFLSSALFDPDLSELAQANIPVVLLNHSNDVSAAGTSSTAATDTDRATTVGVAFQNGARAAVHHLVGHGHERIGLVIGGDTGQPDAREVGWRRELEESGRQAGPIFRVPFTRAGGYTAGEEILARNDRPSAVFVSSDQQAVGLLCALHEGGLRVPEDIAVFAFDGSPEAEYTWPRLSTVVQPVDELARAAMAALLAPDAAHDTNTKVIFDTGLVLRSSCGCH